MQVKNSLKKFFLSLRVTIGFSIVGTVVLTCLVLGFLAYESDERIIIHFLQNKLESATKTAALFIDPELHSMLRTPEDDRKPEYKAMWDRLKKIKDQFGDISNIYTMRMNSEGNLYFVLDSETDQLKYSKVGDVYLSPDREMLDIFKKPYQTRSHDGFVSDKWGRWLTACSPILHPDSSIEGILCMDISRADVKLNIRMFLPFVLIACLIATAFGAMLAAFLSNAIAGSLEALENEMEKIRNFNFGEKFELETRIKEVHKMKTVMNTMKNGLRSFGKYVPANLVRQLISMEKEAVLGAARSDLTVMFTDIVNFTDIAERLGPDNLSNQLDVYFKGMTDPIVRNGGTVDKFMGDGIMAFWGAPVHFKDHAIRACRTALECRAFLEKMSAQSAAKGLPPFHTRFGINSGEVLVGNFGHDQRLDYTAMGENVNIASRAESLNRLYGTNIIICGNTASQVRDQFEIRQIDRVQVKGGHKGVDIYELLSQKSGLEPEFRKFLQIYNSGYEKYMAGNWEAAGRLFAEALFLRNDMPAWILMLRCEEFKNGLIPDSWDGVVPIKEK